MDKFDSQLTTTAIYMAMGMDRELKDDQCDAYQALSDKLGGHIGIMQIAIQCAEESERFLSEIGPQNFPGVYDYEISEPFGAWLGETMLTDPNTTFDVLAAELHNRITTWFETGGRC